MWAISVLGNAKSNRHRKTHGVESDGPARKYMFLPGEILAARAGKKSAEAVVVSILCESRGERRAEELRENRNLNLDDVSEKTGDTWRRCN